jgi:hypothetical protein
LYNHQQVNIRVSDRRGTIHYFHRLDGQCYKTFSFFIINVSKLKKLECLCLASIFSSKDRFVANIWMKKLANDKRNSLFCPNIHGEEDKAVGDDVASLG